MNKKDVLILVALFGLWLLWGPIDRNFIKPVFFPDSPATETVDMAEPAEVEPRVVEADPARVPVPVAESHVALRAPDVERPVRPVTEPDMPEPEPDATEQVAVLENEYVRVRFSSRGGAIRDITLKEYPEFNEEDSPAIVMDFGDVPALSIDGLAGLTPRHDLTMTPLPGGEGVRFSADLEYGLRFVREIRMSDDYVFELRDTFSNTSDHALAMPPYGVRTGRMEPMPGVSSTYGMIPLGVDTLLPAESVKRWGKDIQNRWLKESTAERIRQPLNTPADWVAVKNKYFVQSLRPRSPDTENCIIYAEREGLTRQPAVVWAVLQFPEKALSVGETFTREFEFYVGPQKIDRLSALGYHQDKIMELGWPPIRFFARVLMVGLTFLYGIFSNYGVSIMLLTVIIRVVFWPLTHKGTESMRRMQDLAPLMKELNEKHKDDPQKRQQAIMEMYKEHKVNPLGGCLPMLVQIPVFIGLFYLLRTAIDLRFAGFLWISDLSEPEGILADVLPLPLNILPIFMAITMFFQQKLTPTPSSGDERQQQMHTMMMRFMPIMMLFMLYNFASGLALYWSTQNVLMIVQQLLYRRRLAKKKEAEGTAAVPAAPGKAPKKKYAGKPRK